MPVGTVLVRLFLPCRPGSLGSHSSEGPPTCCPPSPDWVRCGWGLLFSICSSLPAFPLPHDKQLHLKKPSGRMDGPGTLRRTSFQGEEPRNVRRSMCGSSLIRPATLTVKIVFLNLQLVLTTTTTRCSRLCPPGANDPSPHTSD